jgi:hypothetical protein
VGRRRRPVDAQPGPVASSITTFTALRRARITHALARRQGTTQPLDLWDRAASEEATVALATWAYRGRGYRIPQGARLAVASAVRARARTA